LALRLLVVKVAIPLLLRLPVPSVEVPFRNVTDPVGLAEPAVCATVAVNVTAEPRSDWLAEGLAEMLREMLVGFCAEVTARVAGVDVEAA